LRTVLAGSTNWSWTWNCFPAIFPSTDPRSLFPALFARSVPIPSPGLADAARYARVSTTLLAASSCKDAPVTAVGLSSILPIWSLEPGYPWKVPMTGSKDPKTLDKITAMLAATSPRGTFVAKRVSAPDDLHLLVKGVGPIRFPVPPTVDDILGANLTGGETEVRKRIDAWAEAGVSHVVIQPMPPMEGTRFFGEKIIHHYA